MSNYVITTETMAFPAVFFMTLEGGAHTAPAWGRRKQEDIERKQLMGIVTQVRERWTKTLGTHRTTAGQLQVLPRIFLVMHMDDCRFKGVKMECLWWFIKEVFHTYMHLDNPINLHIRIWTETYLVWYDMGKTIMVLTSDSSGKIKIQVFQI